MNEDVREKIEDVCRLAAHMERSLEKMREEFRKDTGEDIPWGLVVSAVGSVFLNLGLKHSPSKMEFVELNLAMWEKVKATLRFNPSDN